MIEVNSLSFRYDQKLIFNDLSFKINKGDFVAIIGSNGSGKSTLIKCLLGEISVNKNKIKILHKDIKKFKQWHKIGYLSQNFYSFNFNFPLTTKELLNSYKIKQDQTYIDDLYKTLGISAYLDQNISTLSGGQLQRVFVAKTLINNPEIIVLDEPVDGMDQQSISFFYDLLKKLNKQGKTILLITHNLGACFNCLSHVLDLGREKPVLLTSKQATLDKEICHLCGEPID